MAAVTLHGGGCEASHRRAVQAGRSDQEIRKCFSAYSTVARLTVLVQICPRTLANLGILWNWRSSSQNILSKPLLCLVLCQMTATLSSPPLACFRMPVISLGTLHTFANTRTLWDNYYNSHFTDKEVSIPKPNILQSYNTWCFISSFFHLAWYLLGVIQKDWCQITLPGFSLFYRVILHLLKTSAL